MDVAYFNEFGHDYNSKAAGNFVKPGLNLSANSSNFTVTKVQTAGGAASTMAVLLSLQVEHPYSHTDRGAPATAEILYEIASSVHGLALNITVQWFNKTMCTPSCKPRYINLPSHVFFL